MWLAKPLYEALPSLYAAAGVAGLTVGVYSRSWYWSEIGVLLGALGIVAGLVLHLRRRGYRASRSRKRLEETGWTNKDRLTARPTRR